HVRVKVKSGTHICSKETKKDTNTFSISRKFHFSTHLKKQRMRSVCEFMSSFCCGLCPVIDCLSALNDRVGPLSSPIPPSPPPSDPVPPVAAQHVVPSVPPPNPPPVPPNANHRIVNVRPQIRGQRRVINGIHPDPPTVWQGAA
ncbi:hypothetical protein PRIPAC_78919, partial [Pristionchus pacificus]|uniref:Uncharacterized protein n=1 Tax=Pristionchus pacificus TaxID=54126 RepID=A0A2A6C3H7_PRIPA